MRARWNMLHEMDVRRYDEAIKRQNISENSLGLGEISDLPEVQSARTEELIQNSTGRMVQSEGQKDFEMSGG